MQKTAYYLGLDGGTSSVGWAVTTPDYRVIKKNGKALWGVRLFDEGKSAEERRVNRTARRRLGRRKWRMKLLQELFAPAVDGVDPSFFIRLSESRYWEEDRTVDGADSLFHDADFSDREYHRCFPTIYHLRRRLMECEDKADIRLVYLAVAHIIKNRGHFLYEGQALEDARAFKPAYAAFLNALQEEFEDEFVSCWSGIEGPLQDALLERAGVSDRKKKLAAIVPETGLEDGEKKARKELIALLSGGSATLAVIFRDESLKAAEIKKICLADGSFDEIADGLAQAVGEERFCLLQSAQGIYAWALFSQILPEGSTISQVKVAAYEKHRADLRSLKAAVRQYAPDRYFKVFRSTKEPANYCAYIGFNKSGGKKTPVKHCKTPEDFYKFLKKELAVLKQTKDPKAALLWKEIEGGTLLPRLKTKDNGVLPYQVHLSELRAILGNASRHYPFLLQRDESGCTVMEKVEKLLTFRVPYYVGPLNDAHREKGFAWVKKRADVPVLPWNFEQVVDEAASEDRFIGRMTSRCTYLLGEDVLPKNSALYARFEVLNELNNVRIFGEKLAPELKQKIYHQLFCRQKKVTRASLVKWLKSEGEEVSREDISGIDGEFKSSMGVSLEFAKIFPEPLPAEVMERCIFALTVAGESQSMLYRRISDVLKGMADEKQIRSVCRLRCTGWGRLSEKLLTGVYHTDAVTGERLSILDMLYSTTNNLMQLLGSDYGFTEQIRRLNAEAGGQAREFTYDALVRELYVSPAVKRSIWQMLLIVKEVETIMGCAPSKIFVEMARGDTALQGRRTVSRAARLSELYGSCRQDAREWSREICERGEELRWDKLYLYYCQMGRCMYTGEKIDIADLAGDNLYDIDHIYPQSRVKDDSLDNRVLVKKTANAVKSNEYPVPPQFRQPELWKGLLDMGLISREKYNRLTRRTGFTDEELAGFINRQLVETRQSTKAAAKLLEQLYPDARLVYVKAGLPSDFRQEFGFVKCREVNDYHHARDAYLNVVVGNVYFEKFTNDPLQFVRRRTEYSLNLRALFREWTVQKGRQTIWEKGEKGSIAAVKAQMAKNDILVTKYSAEAKGALFHIQPLPKGKGQLPLKGSDPAAIERYGGYNNVTGAYFALVRHEVKGRWVKTMEFVPLYLAEKIRREPDELERCLLRRGLVRPEVLIRRIKKGALLKVDGFPLYLAARTEERLKVYNAAQLRAPAGQEAYLKRASNYLKRCKEAGRELEIRPQHDKLTAEENLALYDFYTDKLLNSIYAKRLSGQGQFLQEKRGAFCALSVERQVAVLAEIAHLFQCNDFTANLTELGGPKEAGALKISNKVDGKVRVVLVHQSVTGFFAQEVDLGAL